MLVGGNCQTPSIDFAPDSRVFTVITPRHYARD